MAADFGVLVVLHDRAMQTTRVLEDILSNISAPKACFVVNQKDLSLAELKTQIEHARKQIRDSGSDISGVAFVGNIAAPLPSEHVELLKGTGRFVVVVAVADNETWVSPIDRTGSDAAAIYMPVKRTPVFQAVLMLGKKDIYQTLPSVEIGNMAVVLSADRLSLFERDLGHWMRAQLSTANLQRLYARIDIDRLIHMDAIKNLRDIGGYPAAGGKVVRPRYIFRSGELSSASERDKDTLRKLGIRRLHDLRSEPELAGRPLAQLEKWSIVCEWNPVFAKHDYSPEALAVRWKLYTEGVPGFARAYIVLMDQGRNSYKKILQHVLDHPEEPLLIHCTAGKDRTGVACMLMLSIAGVEDEIISYDYSLTETHLTYTSKEMEHIRQSSKGRFTDEQIRGMLSAGFDAMQLTLLKVREKWGSVTAYVKELGFSDADIGRMRDALTIVSGAKSKL